MIFGLYVKLHTWVWYLSFLYTSGYCTYLYNHILEVRINNHIQFAVQLKDCHLALLQKPVDSTNCNLEPQTTIYK